MILKYGLNIAKNKLNKQFLNYKYVINHLHKFRLFKLEYMIK